MAMSASHSAGVRPAAHPFPGPADDDERRAEVLEIAARLLAEEGPQGLSMRRVATEAGGSTQLVYTLFGGKSGLADALYAEGFARLAARIREALEAAPPLGDPERLVAVGRAYLQFARDEPAFFAVMFGRAITGFTPGRATHGQCRATTFGRLIAEVQACLDADTLHAPDARDLARLCWVTAHGLASLDASGMLDADDPEGFVDAVLHSPLAAHRP